MSLKIRCFTIFKQDAFGNGAERRSQQIKELLENNGMEWEKIPSGIAPINYSIDYIIRFLRVLLLNIQLIFKLRQLPSAKRVLKNTWLYSHFEGVFNVKQTKNTSIILFENSKIEFFHILYHFKKKHSKIVGIPHNLESLVPSQKSGITNRQAPKWFMEEIKMLSACDHVFTISREEALLLNNFKINADYLPYFPVKITYNFLIDIRNKRAIQKKTTETPKLILMLGSYVNIPTKDGINNRLDYFTGNENSDFKLIIAGFGTENIEHNNDKRNQKIDILGKLSNEELGDLLVRIDSILIHQGPASGALTRIQESLIAGIPVIANFNSSRNYFGTEGLYTYSTDDEMIEHILKEKGIPKIPDYPQKEYDLFLEKLAEFNEI